MATEHPLSQIPIEKFVEEHAIQLYEAEKKRRAYQRSLRIFLPFIFLAVPVYILLEYILPVGGSVVILAPLVGIFGGITVYFNSKNKDFRTDYKQSILPLFFKSYYPGLEFQHLLGNPRNLIVVDQEDHRRYGIVQKEDHIAGKLGSFEVEIYEGLVSGNRSGVPYEERSLVAEIAGVAPIELQKLVKKMAIQQEIQKVYRKFQDYPQLISARHGKFYIILHLRQKYLEPNVKEKVYDLDNLKETLKEIDYMIGLIQALEYSFKTNSQPH